jgi:hypothetical protein
MAPSFTSPKQALEQGVCGQHGWSSRYFRDPATGCWCVEVRWGVGPDAGRVFASEDASEDTKPGAKRGHAAAATVALAGLADVLAVANAKPAVTIEAAFGPRFDATCRVVPTWSAFWALCASASPPPVVAIDVEGNLRAPPVLVQACAWCDAGEDLSVCVLEAPSATDGLSADLRRLLADDRVVKVFCDGSGGADKRSLGVDSREGARSSVVDLEVLATELAGATGVKRGLARILNLAWPERAFRATKDAKGDVSSVKFFADVEQGKRPRLGGVRDVPRSAARYAAMDAWCTLVAYRGLARFAGREGSGRRCERSIV